ncbi:hypothetical protein Tco_0600092, partial [Tanacetum coccineum]
EGTDTEKVSTNSTKLSTDNVEEGTAELDNNEPKDSTTTTAQTPTPTSPTPISPTPIPTTFGDDETIAQVLLNMSQAKAPLPKIDPKDKGKKNLKRKMSLILNLKEAEEEVKKLAKEEAIKAALSNEYDFIQARIEAGRLLALRLQEEERNQFTVEERAKFLHDTIAAQRTFLAEQRVIAIRNRPTTRTQLRNQMMTYLKHVGNKKHLDLKNKTFEEIQDLYEKVKRFDESFTIVGSTEDERKIKEMNEGAKDLFSLGLTIHLS